MSTDKIIKPVSLLSPIMLVIILVLVCAPQGYVFADEQQAQFEGAISTQGSSAIGQRKRVIIKFKGPKAADLAELSNNAASSDRSSDKRIRAMSYLRNYTQTRSSRISWGISSATSSPEWGGRKSERLSTSRGQGMRSLWIANAVAVDATPEEIAWLSKQPDVEAITENVILSVPRVEVHAIDSQTIKDKLWNLSAIGADALKAVANGSGVRIGVLDTGINASLPDLAGKVLAWSEFDSNGNKVESAPHETHSKGHGTHVASVMVGETTGIAPCAGLIDALVLPGGSGSIEQVLAGLQWVMDPDGDPNTDDGAQVVNMSWGMLGISDVLWQAVDNLAACGVLPVAAIGNSGQGTTCSPANDPHVVGVGATDEYDAVPTFSGGATICVTQYCYEKPDITAPGVDIPGLGASGSYQLMSGTSLAAPHVSGVAALLLEINPDLTMAELNAFLMNGSYDVDGVQPRQDLRYGWGRLDGLTSYDFLESYAPRIGAADLVVNVSDSSSSKYLTYFSDGSRISTQGVEQPMDFTSELIGTTSVLGLGDVDGDGFADLITSYTVPSGAGSQVSFEVHPTINGSGFSEDGRTWCTYSLAKSSVAPTFIGIGDVNGDKKADLLFYREDKVKSGSFFHIRAFKSDGKSFSECADDWLSVYVSSTSNCSLKLMTGDVNGDGMSDLVYGVTFDLGTYGRPTYYYVALSNGSQFQTPSLWQVSYPDQSGVNAQYLALADVNGDGFADLLLYRTTLVGKQNKTSVYVCLSNGIRMFQSLKSWAEIAWGDDLIDLEAVGDANGDKAGDLIVRRSKPASNYACLEIWTADPQRQAFLAGKVPSIGYGPSLTTNGQKVIGVADVGLGNWEN